jgi:hydrophobic/amphiphilic exporter-1 (mainly G- bacteria), HAE1 family
MEAAYAGLIGAMVRRAGLMVIIALAISGTAMWGLARLPTAFIPIDDQGYLIVAVQLPDGASLNRTTASLQQVNQLVKDIPGVDHVIAISGISPLDNSADLANAGVGYVMFKPFDERVKAGG